MGSFLDFRGFRPQQGDDLTRWIETSDFKPRDKMENDPGFKQIIPYIMLRHHVSVFRYWRTKRAGESRLHHLYSIGIGGHIDQRDFNLFTGHDEVLHEAAVRELKEEVDVPPSFKLRHVGFLNDDETEVGRVHLGIVYEADITSSDVKIRESALSRGEWKPVHELNDGREYETWSRFLIEEYLTNR